MTRLEVATKLFRVWAGAGLPQFKSRSWHESVIFKMGYTFSASGDSLPRSLVGLLNAEVPMYLLECATTNRISNLGFRDIDIGYHNFVN